MEQVTTDVEEISQVAAVECIPDPDDGDDWLEGVEQEGHWFANGQEQCKCGEVVLADLLLVAVPDVDEPVELDEAVLEATGELPVQPGYGLPLPEFEPEEEEAAPYSTVCKMMLEGGGLDGKSEDFCQRRTGHAGAHCPDFDGDLSSGDRFFFSGDVEMRQMGETSGFQFSPDYMEVAPWDRKLAVFVGKGKTINEAALLPEEGTNFDGRAAIFNVLQAQQTGNGWVTGKHADVEAVTHFATVVADPPWQYGDQLPGEGRGAARQYKTMSYAEICQFPASLGRDVAFAEDCRLFLWTTSSFLQEALDVMRAWGFRYQTNLVWDKVTAKNGLPWFGMGRTVRASHELVLVGVRGKPEVRSKSVRSRFEAAVGKHSEKPAEFYRLVEELSLGPYLELFAREHRGPGWLCLGDELTNEGGVEDGN